MLPPVNTSSLFLWRAMAWGVLVVVTGFLWVRGEVQRPLLPAPAGVESHRDLVYRQVGGRQERLDVYVPAGEVPAGGRPAVVAIHGGGWRGGSKVSYGCEAAELARYGYVVVAVNYRLSRPGAPSWPESFEDVREAVRWLRRHAAEYGVDPGRIAALGASAGGQLAALLGTDPNVPLAAAEGNQPAGLEVTATPSDDRSARVQAVIDFYGPTDLRSLVARPQAVHSITLFLGGSPDEVPGRYEAASPLRHVSKDTSPMLIFHGTDDSTIPLSQSQAMADALEKAGVAHRLVVVQGERHGFGFRAGTRNLIPDMIAFLDGVWNQPASGGRSGQAQVGSEVRTGAAHGSLPQTATPLPADRAGLAAPDP